MGNFYVSFAIREAEPARVAAALKKEKRQAFVSPEQSGFVYAYDAECDRQDEAEIDKLGSALSSELQTVVLAAMNHDDDILCYWLYSNGEQIDAYNSFPGYFGSEEDDADEGVLPKGGDAAKLVRMLGAQTSARKVHEVLRADNEREEYIFAVDRHIALATLLGLRVEHCYLGYGYIVGELASEIADREKFLEVK